MRDHSVSRRCARFSRNRKRSLLVDIERLETRTLLAASAFEVDSFLDEPDVLPGDSICASPSGACTLRAAIQEANANPGADVIHLPAGTYALSIDGSDEDAAGSGDLDIIEDMELVGEGATVSVIDAQSIDRVLHVIAATATIRGLSLINGLAADGGNLFVDAGTLQLENVSIERGVANRGGGIFSSTGSIDLLNSDVTSNTAEAGTSSAQGGGLFDISGTWIVHASRVTENRALGADGAGAQGGGIYSEGGTWTISETTISQNRAIGGTGSALVPDGGIARGGGIYVDVGPSLTLRDSAVLLNDAIGGAAEPGAMGGDAIGGGVHVAVATSVTATNTTLSGNRAVGGSGAIAGSGFGGGIFNDVSSFVSLIHATLAFNSAIDGVGEAAASEGGAVLNLDTFEMLNTLVAANVAPLNPDVAGFYLSAGHNLIGDIGTATGFGTLGDLIGTSGSPIHAQLAPLADNGGPTPTHALCEQPSVPHPACVTSSPAIDAGNDKTLGPPWIITTDQRSANFPRLSGLHVDIGAYEAPSTTPSPSTATLRGSVYHDANNNGLRDDGLSGINGATITLTGNDILGNPVNRSIATSTDLGSPGSYQFDGLLPSDSNGYTITITAADESLNGKVSVGTAGGVAHGNMITAIVLAAGDVGEEYNFARLFAARLSGIVYHDSNNNGITDDGGGLCDPVTLTLTGTDDQGSPVQLTTTTSTADASAGHYSFDGLRPSDGNGYTITQVQPTCYLDGLESVGSAGGTSSDNVFASIVLPSNSRGTDYNFGEVLAASIGGVVYHDSNNDGKRIGETGIEGVLVILKGFDDRGDTVDLTTITSTGGSYSFSALRPSGSAGYAVMAVLPDGFFDGIGSPGSLGGRIENDSIQVVLEPGALAAEYNFGKLLPSTIRGTKYDDVTGNGLSSDDVPMAGINITLFADRNGNEILDADDAPFVATTVTDVAGKYSFAGLRPGRYFVQEFAVDSIRTEPTTRDHHIVTVGSGRTHGGRDFANVRKCDLEYLQSVHYVINGINTVTDLTDNVNEGDEVAAVFVLGPTASSVRMSLVTYTAPSGARDRALASQLQVFSADSGLFGAGAGTLLVNVPSSYFEIDFVCGHTIEKFGELGSNIDYDSQARLIDADNGGNAPAPMRPARVSGTVYADTNGNGLRDPGEVGIGGVTVRLNGTTDRGISISLVRSTAKHGIDLGNYSFDGLPPGVYKVSETQPSGYRDGDEELGTLGGKVIADGFTNIVVAEGAIASGYNFGELSSTCVTGRVYIDYNDNGLVDADEQGIGGTVIALSGKNDQNRPVNATTVSSETGEYAFCDLRAGTYSIVQTQPAGFIDGIETRGTVKGAAKGTVSNNKFTGIVVPSGAVAAGYNFGERPLGTTLTPRQTATIDFWKGRQGRDLLTQLNSRPTSQKLGNWLANTFPNLYGRAAGINDLTCKTNIHIADYFALLTEMPGTRKVEAQVLATALAVYVSKTSLSGGSFATPFGFIVNGSGAGAAKFNVLSDGSAFGVANNTSLSVLQLLAKANELARTGVLNGGDEAQRKGIHRVFKAINETGDIG